MNRMRNSNYERSHAHGRNESSFRRLSHWIANEAGVRPDKRGRGATQAHTVWGHAIDTFRRFGAQLIGKLNCLNAPRRAWSEGADPFSMVRNYCKAVEKGLEPELDVTDWITETMRKKSILDSARHYMKSSQIAQVRKRSSARGGKTRRVAAAAPAALPVAPSAAPPVAPPAARVVAVRTHSSRHTQQAAVAAVSAVDAIASCQRLV